MFSRAGKMNFLSGQDELLERARWLFQTGNQPMSLRYVSQPYNKYIYYMAEINAARWLVDYRSGKSLHLARSGNSSCPLKKFILPARENIVQIEFLRKLKLIMPCCDDEEHSPSEFYCHGETNDPNATFQGENNAEQNNSSESVASIVFTTL